MRMGKRMFLEGELAAKEKGSEAAPLFLSRARGYSLPIASTGHPSMAS